MCVKVVVWFQTKKFIKIRKNNEWSLYSVIKKGKNKAITSNPKKPYYLNVQIRLFLDLKTLREENFKHILKKRKRYNEPITRFNSYHFIVNLVSSTPHPGPHFHSPIPK